MSESESIQRCKQRRAVLAYLHVRHSFCTGLLGVVALLLALPNGYRGTLKRIRFPLLSRNKQPLHDTPQHVTPPPIRSPGTSKEATPTQMSSISERSTGRGSSLFFNLQSTYKENRRSVFPFRSTIFRKEDGWYSPRRTTSTRSRPQFRTSIHKQPP